MGAFGRGGDGAAADMDPISVRVPDAVRLTGLSRSRIYELMKAGSIEHAKVGSSTLILFASLRGFVEASRVPVSGGTGD